MKKPIQKIIALILFAALAMGFTGCLNRAPDESSMPWSRPANWENQVPGFQ